MACFWRYIAALDLMICRARVHSCRRSSSQTRPNLTASGSPHLSGIQHIKSIANKPHTWNVMVQSVTLSTCSEKLPTDARMSFLYILPGYIRAPEEQGVSLFLSMHCLLMRNSPAGFASIRSSRFERLGNKSVAWCSFRQPSAENVHPKIEPLLTIRRYPCIAHLS
jgi:hypothetical protein